MQIFYFKKWFLVPNPQIKNYYNNSIFMKSKLLILAFNILVTIPVLLMSTEKKVMSKSGWYGKLMLITVLTLIATFKKKNLQSVGWVSFLKNHLSLLSPDFPRTIPATISPALGAWNDWGLSSLCEITTLPCFRSLQVEKTSTPLSYNTRAPQQRHVSESL